MLKETRWDQDVEHGTVVLNLLFNMNIHMNTVYDSIHNVKRLAFNVIHDVQGGEVKAPCR